MKKTNSLLLPVVILGIGLLTSCAKRSDSPSSSAAATTSAMSASISGTAWTASSVNGLYSTGVTQINAVRSSDASGISLSFYGTATGTYLVDGVSSKITYTKNATTNYSATAGTIVVSSSSNGVMKGTFYCSEKNVSNANDVIYITGGTFTSKY